jgi:ribosomal 50S subunit-associated protein YjgA (DUF615 family)
MTFAEIQLSMGQIFEELKNLEVKLQNAKTDLNKALTQEETCSEGLAVVNRKLNELRGNDVVFIKTFVAAKKDVETVEKFLDQSKAHRVLLQATVNGLEKMQKHLQTGYDNLGIQLAKTERNIVNLLGV